MAPRRKAVASCQALSLKTLEKATGNYIKQATEDFVLAENLLENSIKKVQAYLFHSTPRCLCAQVAKSFINALTSWLKLSIKISTKLTNEHTGEFNDSMYVGLRLAEVIANNHVDHLDLSQVPKQIRSCLYGCLKKMPNLKYLNMGAGHGGWLSDSFCNGFYGGSMEVFNHLVALHFHHDCTDHLLGLITQRNSSTLKILDISFSQNVSDSSAKFIVNCQSLTELDIIGTSLSGQAVVFILSNCGKLKKVNAVRLAQAIEEIDTTKELELVECMPETDRCGFVTATTSRHLKLLSTKCAKIRTLSIFSENNYAPLDWNNNGFEAQEGHHLDSLVQDTNDGSPHPCIEFKNLRVLNTWGGCLQRNFLKRFGAQLIQLKLVHVEQLTLQGSIMEIFSSCPVLESLELQNCSIQDSNHHDHHLQCRQRSHSTDVKLKQLIIVSKCSEAFIDSLLKWISGSTLESIEFGTSTGISDQVLAENINGSLKNLRVFKVAHSTILTMKSVQLLLENCSNLQEISDLTSFPAINRDELLALENHLIQSNIDVILG